MEFSTQRWAPVLTLRAESSQRRSWGPRRHQTTEPPRAGSRRPAGRPKPPNTPGPPSTSFTRHRDQRGRHSASRPAAHNPPVPASDSAPRNWLGCSMRDPSPISVRDRRAAREGNTNATATAMTRTTDDERPRPATGAAPRLRPGPSQRLVLRRTQHGCPGRVGGTWLHRRRGATAAGTPLPGGPWRDAPRRTGPGLSRRTRRGGPRPARSAGTGPGTDRTCPKARRAAPISTISSSVASFTAPPSGNLTATAGCGGSVAVGCRTALWKRRWRRRVRHRAQEKSARFPGPCGWPACSVARCTDHRHPAVQPHTTRSGGNRAETTRWVAAGRRGTGEDTNRPASKDRSSGDERHA